MPYLSRLAATMLTHARLLRRVLLVCSVMTLTGVHEPGERLAAGWRLSRLLSLTLLSLNSLSSLSAVWLNAADVQQALYQLMLFITALFSLVLLTWWCSHRRAMHRLLRLQAALERGRTPRRGDNAALLRQSIILAVLCLGVVTSITTAFVAAGRFEHPNYVMPTYVPVAMRTSAWYPVVIGAQITAGTIGTFCLLGFSLMLPGLVDAVALQLSYILRDLHHCFPDSQSDWPMAADAVAKAGQVAAWTVSVSAAGGGEGALPAAEDPEEEEGSAAAGPDTAPQLRRLSDRYRQVFRLTSYVTDTFSTAVLSLYSATTAVLLLGGYVLVVTTTGESISLYLYMMISLLCMCGISVSGSRLIQQSTQLHDVITKELWPRPMAPVVRRQLELLMEQTRTPLAIEVWDLFSLQKGSVLSVMSFVLTYFVIMLQMIQ